jgi:hypothetical protein
MMNLWSIWQVHGRRGLSSYGVLWGNLKERAHLGDISVDVSHIKVNLRLTLWALTGLIQLRIETNGGLL